MTDAHKPDNPGGSALQRAETKPRRKTFVPIYKEKRRGDRIFKVCTGVRSIGSDRTIKCNDRE